MASCGDSGERHGERGDEIEEFGEGFARARPNGARNRAEGSERGKTRARTSSSGLTSSTSSFTRFPAGIVASAAARGSARLPTAVAPLSTRGAKLKRAGRTGRQSSYASSTMAATPAAVNIRRFDRPLTHDKTLARDECSHCFAPRTSAPPHLARCRTTPFATHTSTSRCPSFRGWDLNDGPTRARPRTAQGLDFVNGIPGPFDNFTNRPPPASARAPGKGFAPAAAPAAAAAPGEKHDPTWGALGRPRTAGIGRRTRAATRASPRGSPSTVSR